MNHLDVRQLLGEDECSSAYERAASAHAMGALAAELSPRAAIPLQGEPTTDGLWLEPPLYLPSAEGQKLVSLVKHAVHGYERAIGAKERRRNDQRNFELLLECITANAVRGAYYREAPWVSCNCTTGAYYNQPKWINGESLSKALKRLHEARLICLIKGVKGRAKTVFKAHPCLLQLQEQSHFDPAFVRARVPTLESLVVLRDSEKNDVRYDPTEETIRWAKELRSYIEFAETHSIDLTLTAQEEWEFVQAANEKRSDDDRQPRLRKPEFFRRHPYRIFSNSSWDEGARMYRTWWQEIPSNLRSKIQIDGQSTIELDYASLLPRLIYHCDFGVDYFKHDDPYLTDDLIGYALEQGLEHDHYRDPAKTLLVALLNAKQGSRGQVGYEVRDSFGPVYSLADVEEQFVQMHPKLATLFRSGIGLKMQRLDSDIAVKVLMLLKDQGILALAVHDSFLVQRKHGELLHAAMSEAYRSKAGFKPAIK